MDDEADYFKVLAELETSRRNAGALESLGLGVSLAPEPVRALERTMEQIDIDGGPVLRAPETERISLLKLCLGALAMFGLMVLLAALFFPADERVSGTLGVNVGSVPSCMAEVPDHELHEAFEPEVAEAELRLRQQRKQGA
jgi:hypothetical protein